jgi:uncharacterized protein (TIGR02271 family)
MAHTVVGFFDNAADAQDAIVKLTKYGINRERVDVSNSGSGNVSNTTDNRYNDSRWDKDRDHENGITRFFKNLFGDDDNDADKYSRVASRAQSIVTVHANSSDEAEQAADILDDCGAVNVDERAAEYGYTGSGNTRSANYPGNSGNLDTSDDYRDSDRNRTEKLDVIREDLEIGKREVERGGVRLRSRIVERPVEETVRLREERVTVDRNPVDRAATDADFSNFEERNIEMIERAEVPVVNKQSRVVEEVSLNKEVEEREETIRDTVRNTEVDIENINRDSRSDGDLTDDRDLSRRRNRNDLTNDRSTRSDDFTDDGI